jgi:hypothetical protein
MSIDERKTLLRNLKRKLKQGGVIIIVDKLLVIFPKKISKVQLIIIKHSKAENFGVMNGKITSRSKIKMVNGVINTESRIRLIAKSLLLLKFILGYK